MVRGERICGLLVDPGAASGLIGTDTLEGVAGRWNGAEEPQGRSLLHGAQVQQLSQASLAKVTALLLESVCPFPCLTDEIVNFLEATLQT